MKISKPFVFKKFTVEQDKCALKVNTDAVLLGALTEADSAGNILEIGTGTGVISLMLAQRFPLVTIHGVEIEKNAYQQTLENFAASPWSDRMEAIFTSFQKFAESNQVKYDLVVSNPPYYEDHLKTQHLERNIALHSDSLSLSELSEGVKKSLSHDGVFYAILPARQMETLSHCLRERGLFPCLRIEISDRPCSQVLRVVQAFSFTESQSILNRQIVIKDSDHSYSAAYAKLLKEFLLIF